MEPHIELNAVRKVFPFSGALGQELFSDVSRGNRPERAGKVAVADVSLTIKQGDRLGIVGSNGAGKSTLLHMIAGLAAPTSGTIEVTGKITSILTLGIGLREHLSGRENIYVDGEIQNRPRAETDKVIDQIIEFADLGDFIEYPVRTYSTGMKARLAFAMITHLEPEILIIDETLSVGDASFSTKATARIKEICDKGKIVIIVSHGMAAINDMCNRCLWMEDGHILMDGAPDEVTHAYIESVRSADEAVLLERFKKVIGNRSFYDGWEISYAGLLDGQSSARRTVIESEERTRIRIKAMVPVDVSNAYIRVQITRLDEVLLFDERFSVNEFRQADQVAGLEIDMKKLALGAAIYRLDIGLEQLDVKRAIDSSIFEVQTLNPQPGGKPMLLYPVVVSAVRA